MKFKVFLVIIIYGLYVWGIFANYQMALNIAFGMGLGYFFGKDLGK